MLFQHRARCAAAALARAFPKAFLVVRSVTPETADWSADQAAKIRRPALVSSHAGSWGRFGYIRELYPKLM
jgi:hypothetical protein